jgi:LPS-assembly lipoprotein
MSLHNSGQAYASTFRRRARLGACLALVAAAAVLAGCGDSGFHPLYATNSNGSNVSERLKEVDFAPIPGRVGQRIRNDLIFQATGGGSPLPPQYRLEVVLTENVTSTLVDKLGEVGGAVYSVSASFRLIDSKAKKVVFQGTSYARAPFERFQSVYSNVRARQDAENRAAGTISDDIKTRLSAFLSRPRSS